MSGGVTVLRTNEQTKTKQMKHKVIGIIGLLLLVLGVVLIILQLMEGGKSVVGTIAAGATPIWMGAIVIAVSRMVERKERKQASREPSDAPKG